MASIAKHNEKTAHKGITRINDLKALWELPAFKRVIMEIIDESGAMRSPYSNSGQSMAYNVGKADIGRTLVERLTMAGIVITTRDCMNKTEDDIKNHFDYLVKTIKRKGDI